MFCFRETPYIKAMRLNLCISALCILFVSLSYAIRDSFFHTFGAAFAGDGWVESGGTEVGREREKH